MRRVAIDESMRLLGVVVSEGSVDLAARVDGQLETLPVRVGAPVRKGDVVATLDVKALRCELAIAEAGVASLHAEQQAAALALQEAEERLRRIDVPKLLEMGAVSQEEVATARYAKSTATARLEGGRARVAEQEARVAQLRYRMSESSLHAPFDGLVSQRLVHPGALVHAGQSVLRLLDTGPSRIRFAIPPAEVGQVQVGNKVRVDIPGREVQSSGQVAEVAPEVDVASQMVFAVAELESKPAAAFLPVGTVVRVSLMATEARTLHGMDAP